MDWLNSLIPASGVNIPQSPYGGLAQADSGAMQGIQGLGQYNLGGQNLPWYQQLTQAGVNNPYANQYQMGAGNAGGFAQAAGEGNIAAGNTIQQAAGQFLPEVQSLMTLGFDPQNALYARTAQQVTDQQNASAASSGLAGTPYAAGVLGQTQNNFNIDWQNNQLNRAATGAGAAGNLYNTAAGGFGAGANLQNTGIGQYIQGASLPYSTYSGINQDQRNVLSGAAGYGQQAAAIPEQQNSQYLQYLNQGAQNQNQIAGLGLQQSQQEFQQAQQLGQDVGQVAGAFATGGASLGMPGGGLYGGGGYGQYFGGGGGYSGGQSFGGGWSPFNGGGFGGYGGNFGGYQPSGAYQGPQYPGMGNQGNFGYGW